MYKSQTNLSFNSKSVDLGSFFIFSLFLLCMILSAITFQSKIQLLFFTILLLIFISIIFFESLILKKRELSFYLSIPVIMSATQNIYLGLITPRVSNTVMQLMIVTNYIFSILLFVVLLLTTSFKLNQKNNTKIILVLSLLILYSLSTIIIFKSNLMSAFASLRNILTPIFFMLLGLAASNNISLKRFLKYISYVSIFVVIFGVIELYFAKDVWLHLNVSDLWAKKGIAVNTITGLPNNFYSSELVNGRQLRRMVSSFADPVNLGTFLFFAFMGAWYLNKKFLGLIIIICSLLAVSKGAFLGILVFGVVWSYYNKSKTFFLFIMIVTGGIGIGFVVYSLTSSTMSMLLHITGFLSSFKELFSHPLGRGLGNIGVLAGLYSNGAETKITESGLGMVIGQLGVIGLILYTYFFRFVYKQINLNNSNNLKIFSKSLLFSIILNIMFNEVALSPNSSAIYFITLGIVIGQQYINNGKLILEEKNKRITKRIKIKWR